MKLMEMASGKDVHELLKIFDILNIPAFFIDESRNVLSCNDSVHALFLYDLHEVVGRSVDALILPRTAFPQPPSAVRLTAFPEETLMINAAGLRKDGSTFPSRASEIPYESHGVHLKIVVVQDLSDRSKFQQKARQRTKELAIFKTFAEILTRHKDIEDILRDTIEMLLTALDVEVGLVYLMDPETGTLRLALQRTLSPIPRISPEVKPGDCLVGKAYHSGKPLLVRKATEDPRVTCIHTGAGGIESMAAVPLSSRGTLLGVLAVAALQPERFTSMDIQLLSTIGNQLAVAIENSTLIGQLRQKMRHIELINELSGIMNSSLSIGTIFRMVVSEIKNLIDFDRASLLLYNETQDNLLIFALETRLTTSMKKGVKAPIEGTSAGWVVRNNAPWINHDLNESRFPLDRKLLSEGLRATISIPLHHDRMLGVFNFDSIEPRKYSEKDLQVLLPIAKHMSIALENALLFEEISKEKKEWERTFDALTDMVWIEDGHQQVIRANRALLARTGIAEQEISTKICGEILERIGLSFSGCLCKDTLDTNRPSFQELKGNNGSIFHFWAYPLIDEEGRLYAIVHYLKDVTEQKRLEQQLIRTDKLASLGTLVSGIAHEINNPLGIIAGFSEALLDRAADQGLRNIAAFEDFPEYLGTIHGEIFRSKNILKSLLEFARPSAGTFRELDINELIKEVMLLLSHKASRLNHHISLALDRELPKILADAGSLRQLLMNLLLNAIYFTPEGGSIVIRTERDPSSCEGEGVHERRMIRLSVSDTGNGVPEDIIGRIFDPFFTTKPVGEGTGLGLTIAHRIVQEHRGTIDVESGPGKGTTFIIRLPAISDHD